MWTPLMLYTKSQFPDVIGHVHQLLYSKSSLSSSTSCLYLMLDASRKIVRQHRLDHGLVKEFIMQGVQTPCALDLIS